MVVSALIKQFQIRLRSEIKNFYEGEGRKGNESNGIPFLKFI